MGARPVHPGGRHRRVHGEHPPEPRRLRPREPLHRLRRHHDSTRRAVPYWDAGGQALAPESGRLGEAEHGRRRGSRRGGRSEASTRSSTTRRRSASSPRATPCSSRVRLRDRDEAPAVPQHPRQQALLRGARDSGCRGSGNPAGATIRSEIYPAVTVPATPPSYATCAKVVVQFAHGRGRVQRPEPHRVQRPPRIPTTYCTRPLPARRRVPLLAGGGAGPRSPSDGLLCPRGLHPSACRPLFSASIPNPSKRAKRTPTTTTRSSDKYRHRNKFALFGANDGMLHAIAHRDVQGGRGRPPHAAGRGPGRPTTAITTSARGEELWAFVPPDLLPKLHLLPSTITSTSWTARRWCGTSGSTAARRRGQPGRSIAAAAPRQGRHPAGQRVPHRGGRRARGAAATHYFALDVTDAGERHRVPGKPRFLWLYPQPDDPEQLVVRRDLRDFVPTPPPIGPVRHRRRRRAVRVGRRHVHRRDRRAALLRGALDRVPVGGFDPQYTRGRGVHMVDVGDGDGDLGLQPADGHRVLVRRDERSSLPPQLPGRRRRSG